MNHFRHYGKVADGSTAVEAAWQACLTKPEIKEDFERQAAAFGLTVQFELSPFTAYWIARNVIRDEWLPGEDLILEDKKVWQSYIAYVESLRSVGCVGWSVRDSEDFVVDDYDVIVRDRADTPNLHQRPQPVERFGNKRDAERLADSIADRVEEFKKQRKAQRLLPKDNDED